MVFDEFSIIAKDVCGLQDRLCLSNLKHSGPRKHALLSRLCKEVNVWVNRLSEETGAMLDPVKVRYITALVRVLSRALKIIKGIALFACFDQ